MVYALVPLCLCLAGVFLWKESRKEYAAAAVLKGLASLCFVAFGFLLAASSREAGLITTGLVLGCIADVLLNLRLVFPKKGQLIFLVSDIVLILNTFGSEFRQSLRNTNISLYYAGQLLIAFSLSLLA